VEPPPLAAQRVDVAMDMLVRHRSLLQRVAMRISLCPDDADDAVQRALEILLRKAHTVDPNRIVNWMTVVTRHEAIAVRRARERLLGLAAAAELGRDPLDELACDRPGPAEAYERTERVAEARVALAQLRADERLALGLQAQGYSYEEIAERCGWTYTKVNRCLAEGRASLRSRTALTGPAPAPAQPGSG
jgi:RNA polymerase sigma factor (sigma-70 family)